ncbi:MAG: formimidoylglutamate deiminase [Cyclobacteriaceae bacterium]|nr:formimidoylglutamate deiminase [Cyclobacteriaceae bacterium]
MVEKKIYFEAIYNGEEFISPAFVELDASGMIISIRQSAKNPKEYECIKGFALPGFQNAHSHAFQYAMAGIAESCTGKDLSDSFWSWRNHMYAIALSLSPDDLRAIAAMLYAEMARQGYTHVAEFHYLHHDKDGRPYSNRSEMSHCLMEAADLAGIGITLVPMYYNRGGFGKELGKEQRRFYSSNTDDYFHLLEGVEKYLLNYPSFSMGKGVHSLRAASETDLGKIIEENKGKNPFHIHISEQQKEIEDCLEFYKARPVDFLLDRFEVDSNFHLVHATHCTDKELKKITDSGAHVVLCPSTEANLGDGIFPLKKYIEMGGRWSIGTDSHVGLNFWEELRFLDYGQRLTTHNRKTYVGNGKESGGLYALRESTESGGRAMGKADVGLKPGKPFNAVVIHTEDALLKTTSMHHKIDTMVYSGDISNHKGTMIRGEWVVKDNVHRNIEEIKKAFIKVIRKLEIRN